VGLPAFLSWLYGSVSLGLDPQRSRGIVQSEFFDDFLDEHVRIEEMSDSSRLSSLGQNTIAVVIQSKIGLRVGLSLYSGNGEDITSANLDHALFGL
jgi:hypothetical protein